MNELNANKVDAVVLDMRGNPGGFLSEAVALAGLFIDQGPVVQVKGSGAGVKHLDDPEKGVAYAGPLVVLVSRSSASAAEIVAATLQDYGRAVDRRRLGDARQRHGAGGHRPERATRPASLRQARRPAPDNAKVLPRQRRQHAKSRRQFRRGPSLAERIPGHPGKGLDYALPFDHVQAIDHENVGMVSAQVKAMLKSRSAERVAASKDFAKLAKSVERLKAVLKRKSVPLNEQELKEQTKKEDAEMDKADEPPVPKVDDPVYKFPRTFTNNEVLKIVEDLLQGTARAPVQGRNSEKRRAAPIGYGHVPSIGVNAPSF